MSASSINGVYERPSCRFACAVTDRAHSSEQTVGAVYDRAHGPRLFSAARIPKRYFWGACSREVRPAAARDQRTVLVVNVGFGGRELTADAQHAPFSGKVARHGCLVIVHPDVYRGHRPADPGGDRIVCGHIHDRRKNAAMRISALQ